MLTQVGIRTRLRTSPSTQFFPMITQARVSLAEYGFTGTLEDAWQGLDGLLHTRDENGGGTFNAGRYSSRRLDALIDAVRTERDPEKSRVLVGTALKLAGDDVAYVRCTGAR